MGREAGGTLGPSFLPDVMARAVCLVTRSQRPGGEAGPWLPAPLPPPPAAVSSLSWESQGVKCTSALPETVWAPRGCWASLVPWLCSHRRDPFIASEALAKEAFRCKAAALKTRGVCLAFVRKRPHVFAPERALRKAGGVGGHGVQLVRLRGGLFPLEESCGFCSNDRSDHCTKQPSLPPQASGPYHQAPPHSLPYLCAKAPPSALQAEPHPLFTLCPLQVPGGTQRPGRSCVSTAAAVPQVSSLLTHTCPRHTCPRKAPSQAINRSVEEGGVGDSEGKAAENTQPE